MIKLVGVRRLAIVSVLALFAVALALAFFLWVEPLRKNTENKLNTLKSDISSYRGKILNIKEELKALKESMKDYESMEEEGFFIEQDRFMVSDVLEEIRQASGVYGFEYTISALQEIENNDAKSGGYNLINSRIQLSKLSAFLDTDIYQFMAWIDKIFPGHTRIHMFKLEKKGEVDNELLKSIVAGKATPVMEGKLIFDWQSLVPIESSNSANSDFQDNGFQ